MICSVIATWGFAAIHARPPARQPVARLQVPDRRFGKRRKKPVEYFAFYETNHWRWEMLTRRQRALISERLHHEHFQAALPQGGQRLIASFQWLGQSKLLCSPCGDPRLQFFVRHESAVVSSLFATTNCIQNLDALGKLIKRRIVGQLIHGFQNEFFIGHRILPTITRRPI